VSRLRSYSRSGLRFVALKTVACIISIFASIPIAWAQCSGACSVTTVGGDTVLTFTGNGTFTPPAGVTGVRYNVVGGGGGGGGTPGVFLSGSSGGGGGGAGGMLSGSGFTVTPLTVYNIVVGGGGVGGNGAVRGDNGGNSSFSTLIAVGGGGGGADENGAGLTGGSGGGGYNSAVGGNGTGGQGSSGGNGGSSRGGGGGGRTNSGGGGGAGNGAGGIGGAGLADNINGTNITYAAGGEGGAYGQGRSNGTSAAANTGNGGGGANGGAAFIAGALSGGNGGSGIVIIRYTPLPMNYYSRQNGNWSANATWSTSNCGGAAATSIPHPDATVTICNSHMVTLDQNAVVEGVILATGNSNVTLSHSGSNALTVGSGGVTLNGGTGGNHTKTWDVGAGSATVNGPVSMNGGSNNNRLTRIGLTTGTLNINGDLTMTAANNVRAVIESTGAANIYLSGDFNFNNGTLTPGPSSTFTYDGPGGFALAHSATIQYRHLVVNKPGGSSTQTGSALTVLGDLHIQAGTVNIGTATVNVSGTSTITGTLGFTSTTGTATFGGDVTISGGGVWNNPANEAVSMDSSLFNNGTFNSGTATYTFTGDGQWGGNSPITFSGPATINANLTRTNNNPVVTVTGNLTLGNSSTMTNNGSVTVTNNLTGANGASTWTNATNSTLAVGATLLATGTLSATATENTVIYSGTGNQTVKITDYFNLTVDKSGGTATTSGGTVNITGTLSVDNGSLSLNTSNIIVDGSTIVSGTLLMASATGSKTFNGDVTINNGGTWNHTANAGIAMNDNLTNNGTFTAGVGANAIYTFGGSSEQTITGTAGTTTISRLTLNNTNGLSLTGTHDLTVSTLLTLTNGRIRTNANILFVSYTAGNGAISGASATDFVVGNLRKAYTANATQTRLFEVGTETGGVRYAPVSVTLVVPAGGGNAGNFTVSSTAGDHPDIATSTLDPAQSINRFWTLSNNSVNFSTNANTSITFNFVNPDDYDGGADFNDFYVGRYNAPDWTEIEPSARTATTVTIPGSGITTATVSGDYQIAEQLTTPPAPVAWYNMQEDFWAGVAGEVLDQSGNDLHGQAVNGANTDSANPAVPGSPGTCGYGVFDGNNQFVQVPYDPALNFNGPFSVTAWINPASVSAALKTIVSRDWNYEFHLTSAGQINWWWNNASNVVQSIETTGAAISAGNWYHIAIVYMNGLQRIYINGVQRGSGTFTGGLRAFTGTMDIGADHGLAGRYFDGSLDEIRVFDAALTAGQIATVMNDTYPCEPMTATVTTPATGGEAISADTAPSGNGLYSTLTGPVISETDVGGLRVGEYTLTVPAGFEFDTAANSVSIAIGTVSGTGADINLGGGAGVTVTVTPAASVITFNVTGLSGSTRLNNLTFSGIRVRPIDGCPGEVADDIIFATTTSTTITSDVAGTLTMVAGNAARMLTVLPGQSAYDDSNCGSVAGAPDNQLAGNAFNLSRLVVTDQFGNIQQGYSGTQTISYSGPGIANGTPPVYTNSVSFTNGQSTTTLNTTLYRAESTTITATDGVLTGIASSSFNVIGGTATLMHVVLPGQAFVSGDGAIDSPADQVLDVPFLLTALVASDAWYNLTNFSGSHAITYTLSPPAGGSTFTSPVSFTAGVSTTTLSSIITVAGNYTLSASGGGLTAVVSTAFNVRGTFICTGWDYHKVITIDHTRVGSGGVTDFPVLISITDTDLRDKAMANGNDILFTDSSSTIKLAHEIESWNDTTGELIAWVKVPAISSTEDTDIIMYYGNPFAAPQQSPTQVWDSNYRMVQHLNESGGVGTTLLDSTSNSNHGSVLGTGGNHPSFVSTGKIDGARNHPGSASTPDPVLEFAHTASLAITGNITGEAWAYIESGQPTPDHNPVFWKGTQIGWGANYQFRIAVGPGGVMTWGVTCGAGEGYFEAGVPVLNQWAHYAMTWDGTTARAYINGVLQTISNNPAGATLCSNQALNATTAPVRSGYTPSRQTVGQEAFLRGQTDELRISATARSAAWLLSQYNNQNSPVTFYSIGSEQEQDCVVLDHIRIEHDGLALTCAPETVTVRACTDAACSSEYTDGEVITTLTPSGWVDGNTITFTGSTTASLRQNVPGIVALGSGSTTPTPANSTRCFVGVSETCSIDFKDSGFIFDIPTLISHKTSPTVTITAVRTDETTQTCAPAFTGSKSVNFWSTYSNPGTGTQQVRVNSTDVATSGPGGTPVSLNFDVNAQANFSVRYPDAGQMQLNARYTGTGDEAGLIMDGNDQFVSIPAGLCVETDSVCPTGDIACDIFAAAGSPFELRVKAVGWESDGESNEQFCSGNAVTQNFRLDNIDLTADRIAPVAGVDGMLGISSIDIEAADNGLRTETTQSISEVGVFTVTATPPAYFGETIAASTSDNIGRFIPYDFDVALTTPPVFGTACDVFTYIGQPFGFSTDPVMTVTARAEGGSTTENYIGEFNRITAVSLSYPGDTNQGFREGSPEALGLDTGVIFGWKPGINDLGSGLTRLTFSFGSHEQISFNRLAPVEPFDAEISLEINVMDGDGVFYGDGAGTPVNPARFGNIGAGQGIDFDGNKEQRWGRLSVENTYGSELLPLHILLRAEYFHDSDSGFLPNPEDMCTTYMAADVNIADVNPLDSLGAGDVAVLTPVSVTNLVNGEADPAHPLKLSNATDSTTGPGEGKTGVIQFTLDLSSLTGSGQYWLLYDWDDLDGMSNGPYDTNPSAQATFGIYRGSRNFIYIREPWN